jgi:glycosyltransferase involved in cell wall biosynthesis
MQHDIVLAHLLRTAQYIHEDKRPPYRVLEMTDAISLVLQRARAPGRSLRFRRLIYAVEYDRVKRYERRCIERFECVTLVSSVDRDYLAATHGASEKQLLVATNGVARRDSVVATEEPQEILFLGNMNTLPNVDACEFFILSCLPAVIARFPKVRFRIVGPIAKGLATHFASLSSAVIVSGAVDDLRSCIEEAFCGVAPMRKGSGIQNKILDYMSYGLPCVTTAIGYEGLAARIDSQVLVKDSPRELAEAVIRLKSDRELRERIGAGGRQYVQEHHSWERCVSPLLDRLRCMDPE